MSCSSEHLLKTDNVYLGDILEMGAFWSVRSKDIPSFDRYFSQLQTLYTDYRHVLAHIDIESDFYLFSSSTILPPSSREYPLQGLNLIRLLTQNRIADFHTTLESLRLPPDAAEKNPYIQHPVNVERWLMEGSYSKVWNAREEAPAEEYRLFVDSLMGTIRYRNSFQMTHIYSLMKKNTEMKSPAAKKQHTTAYL